jgi:hypothetical protein
MQDGMARLRRLHQVPCSRCAYFTGEYRLKCAVHPCRALSELAIGCTDYELKTATRPVIVRLATLRGAYLLKTVPNCFNSRNLLIWAAFRRGRSREIS